MKSRPAPPGNHQPAKLNGPAAWPTFPLAWLPPEQHTRSARQSTASSGPPAVGTHGFLQGVDEVLQVNVVPVGSNVALEELPEAVPHPVLE